MTLQPIAGSSNIKAIGYDPSTRKLHVQFHSSGTYEFDDVPPEKHAALVSAQSVGKHFQTHIRYHHDFTKL